MSPEGSSSANRAWTRWDVSERSLRERWWCLVDCK